jgi:hypothetical protein
MGLIAEKVWGFDPSFLCTHLFGVFLDDEPVSFATALNGLWGSFF